MIEIMSKFFALISILMIQSVHNFAHVMKAQFRQGVYSQVFWNKLTVL